MKDVIEGFLRFQKEAFPQRSTLFKKLALNQNPKTLFISCSDSRLVPELVTQREPGELFVIRNAGNIVPPFGPEPGGVSATVEYAVMALGIRDIVVCGHSDCGAMTAVANCTCLDHMPAVAHWLSYADAAKAINDSAAHETSQARVNGMVHANVIAQLGNLRTHPCVALALAKGEMNLHGWVYDIESGSIEAFDSTSGKFISLSDNPDARAT